MWYPVRSLHAWLSDSAAGGGAGADLLKRPIAGKDGLIDGVIFKKEREGPNNFLQLTQHAIDKEGVADPSRAWSRRP